MSPATQPLRVQMIGGPGVGKSSLIGALALLAENPSHGYFVTPTDADTKRRFADLRASFRNGTWPSKTSASAPIHCRIHRRGKSVTIRLEDFAGEAFLAAMQRGGEDEQSRQIESSVDHADLLLVMIDGGKLNAGSEIAAQPLIQAIAQRIGAQNSSENSDSGAAVAVVLTKADLFHSPPLRTAKQAKNRVTHQVSGVAEFLRGHARRVEWLPLSVCGYHCDDPAAAAGPKFAPAGFDQLFELLFSLADQPVIRRRKQMAAAILGSLLVAVAIYHYRSGQLAKERVMIEDPVARVQDLPAGVAAANEAAYRQRVRQAAVNASDALRVARSEREVEDILQRLSGLPEPAERLAHDELVALRQQGQQRIEQLLYARLTDAAAQSDSEAIRQAIDQYLKRYPSGPHAEQARILLASEEDKRRRRAGEEIKSIVVWDSASLQRKLQRIATYLDEWDSVIAPSERASIEQATAAARRMLERNRYQVTLVRTAGLDRPRAHGVRVQVGGAEVARFEDSGNVSEKIWNQQFTVQWQLGMKVDVTLLNFRFRNSEIASIEGRGPMAILTLASTHSPTRYASEFASSRPPVSIKFRCAELDEPTVAAIEAWIFPGSAW